MCNAQCLGFVERHLTKREVRKKRVLEVGAYDVNGSARPIVQRLQPSEYIGVDLTNGPGVDLVCDVNDLVDRFGPQSFDVVITTEMLEHVSDWRLAIHNLKAVIKPGGLLLLTTRSEGFPLHDYPGDHWRFSPEDMRVIFADCEVGALEQDEPTDPGVFIKVKVPTKPRELDLTWYAIYSMETKGRLLG